jgi:CBS domain-containing protein
MERLKDSMTKDPVCCLPTTNLKVVAKLMIQYKCSEIPVVYSIERPKVIGIITDRDIINKTVAHGLNPLEMTAEEVMTTPVIVVAMEMTINDCCLLMKEEKINSLPVVDKDEYCCGMITMRDIKETREKNFS